jgi:hypothetical protein
MRNYNSVVNRLNFRTLYSRRQHLNVLFLVNVFKDKVNCCSIIPIKQVRDFTTFNMSYVSRLSPLSRCVAVVNSNYRFVEGFNKHTIFLFEDNFSFSHFQSCLFDCFCNEVLIY